MTFLVVLIIALAWVGALWAWSRDRFLASSASDIGLPSLHPRSKPPGPLSPPRSAPMARRRRREVLSALGLVAVTTLFLARAWSAIWPLHLLIDGALIAYGWAVLAVEHPQTFPVRPSLEPVAPADTFEPQRPGPRREPVDSTIG